jgi:hypothetical protein
MLEYELFFGRSIPGRSALTDREWAEFATHVVTPRLPDGFTAFDAEGQWMNPTTHRIIAERTKIIVAAVRAIPAAIGGRLRACDMRCILTSPAGECCQATLATETTSAKSSPVAVGYAGSS